MFQSSKKHKKKLTKNIINYHNHYQFARLIVPKVLKVHTNPFAALWIHLLGVGIQICTCIDPLLPSQQRLRQDPL